MGAEYFNASAALLGVVLTAIASFFAYRRTELNNHNDLRAAARTGQLAGVAGAVASAENTKLYVQEFQNLTGALDRLTEATNKHSDAALLYARAATENTDIFRDLQQDVSQLRRAIQDISYRMSQRSEDPRR